METHTASYIGDYDFPISTLFWGFVIFVAMVAAWILVGRAIGWLRDRRRIDGGAVEGAHPKGSQFDQTFAEVWNWEDRPEHGTRKQRKAMRRRKARETAQKQQDKS